MINWPDKALGIAEFFYRLHESGAINLEDGEWDTLFEILDKVGKIEEPRAKKARKGEDGKNLPVSNKNWNDYIMVADSTTVFSNGKITCSFNEKKRHEKKTICFKTQHDLDGVNWAKIEDRNGNCKRYVLMDGRTGKIMV